VFLPVFLVVAVVATVIMRHRVIMTVGVIDVTMIGPSQVPANTARAGVLAEIATIHAEGLSPKNRPKRGQGEEVSQKSHDSRYDGGICKRVKRKCGSSEEALQQRGFTSM
jgi:hypothetical protein